jgi:ATP-dependent RNA helicase CshB
MTEIHGLKYQYVVASDLMARGIDFKCSHVINYDLPNNLEFFTHRSGRTGRMGDSGIVITIQTSDDQRKIQKLKNQGTEFINYVLTDDGFKKIVKPTGPVLTDDEKNKLKQVKTGKKVKPNYKKKHQAAVKKQLQQIKKKRYQNETKNR